MKLTKGIVDRKVALELAPVYVDFAEGNFDKWEQVDKKFGKLKIKDRAITYHDGKFILVKVSHIFIGFPGADGPVVQVSNGEYSWRVDGDKYAYPIK